MTSSNPGLRVLVVSPDLPYPPSWGFGMRVYQLTRGLARHGHRVTFLAYRAGHDRSSAEQAMLEFCDEVRLVDRGQEAGRRLGQLRSLASPRPHHAERLVSPQMQAALDDLLTRGSFDVIHVESTQMSCLDYRGHPGVVYDEHNIESELLRRVCSAERGIARRVFNAVEARKYERLERRAWPSAMACLTTSAREQAVIRAACPDLPVQVVPNGVDPDHFLPGEAPPKADTVTFNGVLGYRPNFDAARWFARDIMPLLRSTHPDLRFVVVGAGTVEQRDELTSLGAVAMGWVTDVRPHLGEAAVVVVPIRMGSGTRLKVLEALAMRKPVVTTALGAEGIDVDPGTHVLAAEGAADFAAAVARLLDDRRLAAELGEQGRRRIVDRYSWDAAGQTLADFYAHLAAEHPALLEPRRGGPGLPVGHQSPPAVT